MTALIKQMPAMKAKVRPLNVNVVFGGSWLTAACAIPERARRPRNAPTKVAITENKRLSRRNWRTRCRRSAPIDRRTAISLLRAERLARKRFETLAQAMSRTAATAASRRRRVGRRLPASSSVRVRISFGV